MQIKLRLFLLLAIVACLIVAWLGVTQQPSLVDQTLKGENERHWESFGEDEIDSRNSSGGISFDGNGKSIYAQARSDREIKLLQEREDVCRTLPHLSIYGPEAFAAFDPNRFKALETFSIGGVAIDDSVLSKMTSIADLRELRISDFSQNPVEHLHSLNAIATLRTLTIRSSKIPTLDDFPVLDSLDILTVDCAGLSNEAQQSFRDRYPGCLVSINTEPYRDTQ